MERRGYNRFGRDNLARSMSVMQGAAGYAVGGGRGRAISISARPRIAAALPPRPPAPPPAYTRTAPNSPCALRPAPHARDAPLYAMLTLKIVFSDTRVFTPNPDSGPRCTLLDSAACVVCNAIEFLIGS